MMTKEKKVSVLVVEDSQSASDLMCWIIGQDESMTVAGVARNGQEAVEMTCRLRPDVVTMDVVMPVMDGLEATRQIMKRCPTPIVIVSAIYDAKNSVQNFEALCAGALVLLHKPVLAGESTGDWRRLLTTLKVMSRVDVSRHAVPATHALMPPAVIAPQAETRRTGGQAVVMGASTGGPRVLATLLGGLPANFPVPILVVQHIAPGFLPGMVEWLGGLSRLRVKVAEQGETCRPGIVYFAPDGHHMGITRDLAVSLVSSPPIHGACPSVAHLFESAARILGRQCIGVLLSGMGDDGAKELGLIRTAGGLTIVESPESAIMPGTPQEAVRQGAAVQTLPIQSIAECLVKSVSKELV
jgi:two-component system chemotaxis response regulator CheB